MRPRKHTCGRRPGDRRARQWPASSCLSPSAWARRSALSIDRRWVDSKINSPAAHARGAGVHLVLRYSISCASGSSLLCPTKQWQTRSRVEPSQVPQKAQLLSVLEESALAARPLQHQNSGEQRHPNFDRHQILPRAALPLASGGVSPFPPCTGTISDLIDDILMSF